LALVASVSVDGDSVDSDGEVLAHGAMAVLVHGAVSAMVVSVSAAVSADSEASASEVLASVMSMKLSQNTSTPTRPCARTPARRT